MILFLILLEIVRTMVKNRKLRLEITDEDDDVDLFTIPFSSSLVLNFKTEREWYVLPRSTHWRQLVFSSNHFLDCQFKDTFRMSGQWFFALHALLHPHIRKKQTHLRPIISSE